MPAAVFLFKTSSLSPGNLASKAFLYAVVISLGKEVTTVTVSASRHNTWGQPCGQQLKKAH